jgi:Ca2+-binding EF-hand superfamily protein
MPKQRKGLVARRVELTEAEKHEIEDAFDVFAEGRGSIDAFELKVALKALGFSASKAHVRSIFETGGYDPTAMRKAEFCAVVAKKFNGRDLEKEIKRAFALFDTDQTGVVTVENLQHVVRELGETIDVEEMEQMVAEFDHDEDGVISRTEFAQIFRTESTF